MKYNNNKKAVIAACAYATAALTIATALPMSARAASVSILPVDSALAGISVPMNNYYASSLTPEKELKEFLETKVSANTISETESQEPSSEAQETTTAAQTEPHSDEGLAGGAAVQKTTEAATKEAETKETEVKETEAKETEAKETETSETATSAAAGEGLAGAAALQKETAAETEAPTETPTETQAPSPYDNIAITQVSNYVNIRDTASTEGEVVGKIYDKAAATILDTVDGEDGQWYYIESGNVKGYMKAEFFVTGEEAERIAKEVGTVWARTTAVTLKLRQEPSTESLVMTLLAQGETYLVREENIINEAGENFIEILVSAGETEDDSLIGYISSDYADVYVEFEEAISKEEEEAELARIQQLKEEEEAARRRIEEEERAAAEAAARQTTAAPATTAPVQTEPSGDSAATGEAPTAPAETQAPTEAPTEAPVQAPPADSGNGAIRDAIVARAKQYAGNLSYVYGGTSLSSGVDCSGFTQAIYREYGISIPRDAASQAYGGTRISRGDLQPGDLVFYSNGGGINHVGMYIGGGQIVHAANRATGVKISSMDYSTPVGYGRYTP